MVNDDLEQKIMYISHLSHTFEMSVPSHPPWCNRTSSISCVSRFDGDLKWIIRIIYVLIFISAVWRCDSPCVCCLY